MSFGFALISLDATNSKPATLASAIAVSWFT